MEFVTAIVPPAVLVAVVIYMMRDLKADMRDLRAELGVKLDKLGVQLDKLADDHNNLSRELSELRGAVQGGRHRAD